MNKLPIIIVTLLAMVFAGCAATVQRSAAPEPAIRLPASASSRVFLLVKPKPEIAQSQDWETFRAEWRTAMASAATTNRKQFVYLDTDRTSFAEHGTLVVVTVNDYRYLTSGARYGFRIMTGNAFIDADAAFYELPSRRNVGTRKYVTSSTAWEGIFSAMTDKQVQSISAEILKEVDQH